MAAFSNDKWEEFNPSLMASTVLGSSNTQHRFCSAFISLDHNKQECTLSSMDPNVSRTNALNAGPSLNRSNSPLLARPSYRAKPYVSTRPRNDICQRFNKGTCYSSAINNNRHISNFFPKYSNISHLGRGRSTCYNRLSFGDIIIMQSSTTIFAIPASALVTVVLNAKGSQQLPLRQELLNCPSTNKTKDC